MQNTERALIGGKTLEEWDREWTKVEGGLKHYHPGLRHVVGVYRLRLAGQIVVIGTGTDKRGGLAKRLSDFIRRSPSARKHHAAQLAHGNRDHVEVEVLRTGDDEPARVTARRLKTPMIQLHKPVWTVPKPFMRKG